MEWDWGTIGVLYQAKGASHAYLLSPNVTRQEREVRYDPRLAAMCSAALPVICSAYRIGERSFLDGGMEANLPIGIVREHGLFCGVCGICIIPRPVHALDPEDHVDYRVLRFLRDLQLEQGLHRAVQEQAHPGETLSMPAHTQYGIIVITPPRDLESALIEGFLRPELLWPEFCMGLESARVVAAAMDRLFAGDDHALDAYLLENSDFSDLPANPPPPKCWALWANPRWLNQGGKRGHRGGNEEGWTRRNWDGAETGSRNWDATRRRNWDATSSAGA